MTTSGVRSAARDFWAHSVEIEYGLTDHLSVSGYADFEDPRAYSPQFTEGRVEARYHFANAHEHFFDTAVYAEYVFLAMPSALPRNWSSAESFKGT